MKAISPRTRWISWILSALLLLLIPFASAVAGNVWVNTNSGVYHCPGTQYFGNTKRGQMMSESTAVARGFRAAYGRPCSSQEARQTQNSLIQSLRPTDNGHLIRVWINTSSHVYHCPDSRYYGSTKRGRFASEAEAISSGNRPAYGQRCN